MTRREGGFTLMELMVALVACGAVAAIAGLVEGTLRTEQRHADARARDLAALSEIARRVSEDLRAGAYPRLVRWSLDGRILRRGDEVVADGVREWAIRRQADGHRVHVEIVPRSVDPGTHGPVRAEFVVRTRVGDIP